MLELLVVLGVLALVIVIALPHLPRRAEAAAVRAAASSLADGLRESRGLAIRRNSPVLFSLDVAARRWTIQDGRSAELPQELALALETDRRLLQSREAGAIRFFADGSATGGRIVLSRDGVSATVVVDWLTGQVAVDD
ncbi:MAG: GspH/FimT family protein [Kiloniellaceae bacterium]